MKKQVILHSYGVAEYMYRNSNKKRDEMYILGLLHDIGKIHGFDNHELLGGKITKDIGFIYSEEIKYHGIVQSDYSSYELDLLNAADLSIDSEGNEVGYIKRIEDIKTRYGEKSTQYIDAVLLSKELIKKKMLI